MRGHREHRGAAGLLGAKVLVLRLLPEGRREQMWFLKASLEMKFSQKELEAE